MILTNFSNLTILSLGYMMLFTAFNTCQNLSAKVMKDNGFDNLGYYSIAILYFCFSICSFFATAIVNKIGNIRISMSLGALCYSFWVLCFILPSFYARFKKEGDPRIESWYMDRTLIQFLSLLTAAVNGAGAGVLWVS